jgi:hypothetical protein
MMVCATPRAETRGATLAEGADKTVAPAGKAYHGAGSQAKRSPKEQGAIPGKVTKLPKAVLDRPAVSPDQMGPRRRPGSGQQDRGGMGTDLGAERPGAGRPMPFAQALTIQQINLSSTEQE